MSDAPEGLLNRRAFLQNGLALAGGLAVLGPREGLAIDRNEPAHWAFLSDTHIAEDPDSTFRGFRPYQTLQEITAQIGSALPDGLVITGDLARLRGHAGDYRNLRTLLTPLAEQRPIHLATGNHDNRDNFRRAFAGPDAYHWAVKGKHIVTVHTGPVRLVILDSLLFIDLPWGQLGRAQRRWLDTYLRVCDNTPVVLFVHHPIAGKDAIWDARHFLDLVKPIAKVKAIVHGHSHKFRHHQFEGIHVIGLPATGYNMYDEDPVGWVSGRLTKDHGVFTLHAIDGNTRLNSHTQRLRWRT